VGLAVAGAIVGSRSPVGLLWFVPFGGVGALLAIRRPRTSIGWILLGLGWAYEVASGTVPGTLQQWVDGSVDIPSRLLAVVGAGSGPAAFFLLAALATVFPSGRLPTGPWGRLGRVALAVELIMVVSAYVMPVISISLVDYPASVRVHNPIALLPDLVIWQAITPDTAIFPVIGLFIAATVSLVVRARRASGTERQQLRWIAASIAFSASAVLCGFAIGSLVPGSSDSGLAWIPALVAFPSVPVAVGIAVLRYRLYEIDRIISRTVGWALLTSLLGAVFAGLVVGLQAASATFTSGNTLAVAASTLIVAALFQPLRRRIQVGVDRRFNRARYDAQQTVDAFAEHLRNEVDLGRLRSALIVTADEAVHPATSTVWLREATG
jgi:hypothetical protein